jgi:hypothetical protein
MRRTNRTVGYALAAATLFIASASEARAGCFGETLKSRAAGQIGTLQPGSASWLEPGAAAGSGKADTTEPSDSIVGLWRVEFLVGDGPDVAFKAFQQWHQGGTETMVDNGVPPSLGNVCVGVWKQTGPRTFKLRHVTFNWDEHGTSTGTFQVIITVKLNRKGDAYTGTYTADSFDLAGNVIPDLHTEGRLRATRISVE